MGLTIPDIVLLLIEHPNGCFGNIGFRVALEETGKLKKTDFVVVLETFTMMIQ
jgi:hypothetical protein